MFKLCVTNRLHTGVALTGVFLALLTTAIATPAQARHRHHLRAHHVHIHHARHSHGHRGHAAEIGGPAFASIVVDGNTGRTLYAQNENELRHPASITKVMTLYLLFEQLEKGKFNLGSEIGISRHAAAQAPSKLGLRPGSTIRVDDAIKAIVTKSANDIAVAVAEAVGGNEDDFAEMMTQKAHALGMSHTVYRNASGLPNSEQVTSARDLTVLGRAIQERFPHYYRFFSTRVFNFAGESHRNHNHLLGRVEGMDGIKTGYTAASGFNLLTSVRRNGHFIVSAVLGGRTAHARDNIMADLIEDHIEDGATGHAAVRVAENESETDVRPHAAAPVRAEADARPEPARVVAEAPAPPHPEPAREWVKPEPKAPRLQLAALAPDPKPRPAYISASAKPAPGNEENVATASVNKHAASRDGSTRSAFAPVTPSAMRWSPGPQPKIALRAAAHTAAAQRSEQAKASVEEPEKRAGRPANAGWMIQVGATDDAGKANDLLMRAKSRGKGALASARGFTEKVQKGSETLYRARFAGLEENSAETACKTLKRTGFSCFATRN